MTERIERRRITEELCDPDQEVLVQGGKLTRIAIERFAVLAETLAPSQHHSPLDTAPDRGSFVVSKVYAVRRAKLPEDVREDRMFVVANVLRALRCGLGTHLPRAEAPAETRKLTGNRRRTQHEIHTARLDRVRGHRREARQVRLLRERESARVLDGAKPQRAVRVAA